MDTRNRLIIPTVELALQLRPRIVLLENVPEMEQTPIADDRGHVYRIVDYMAQSLGPEYSGRAEVVEFADYGVPQCRQRLITVFSRDERLIDWLARVGTFMPDRTHAEGGRGGRLPWVTVHDAIADLPRLDAADARSATSPTPYHRVPILDPMKYWWVKNTPPERSAFDNQCASCGFAGNPTHVARRNELAMTEPRGGRVGTSWLCGSAKSSRPRETG